MSFVIFQPGISDKSEAPENKAIIPQLSESRKNYFETSEEKNRRGSVRRIFFDLAGARSGAVHDHWRPLCRSAVGFPAANFYTDLLYLEGFERHILAVDDRTNATSLSGPLPELRAGAITVKVYNQDTNTGSPQWTFIGSTALYGQR